MSAHSERLARLSRKSRAYASTVYANMEAGSCRRDLDRLGLRLTGKKILDVGFGPGQMLIEMAREGSALVVGADFRDEWFRFVREEVAERDLSSKIVIVRADAMALPFETATFDVVTCLLTLPYVADDQGALLELSRVLKPGGVLVVSGHDLGFPLAYLKDRRLKPLLLYPLTLAYRLLGTKPLRNTLQTHRTTCRQLDRAGIAVDDVLFVRGPAGSVRVFTIRGTKAAEPAARRSAVRGG